jgi:hypothetical protein
MHRLKRALAFLTASVSVDCGLVFPGQSYACVVELADGPIPALFLLLGLTLFYRFPLTRERHAEVQAALAARRG